MSAVRTFVLLVDSECNTYKDSWLARHAAINLTRVVLQRGAHLIVRCDASTMLSILLTAGEYHRPVALESETRWQRQLWVLPPIDFHGTSDSPTVEDIVLRQSGKLRPESFGLLESLAYWSNANSEPYSRSWLSEAPLEKLLPSVKSLAAFRLGNSERLVEELRLMDDFEIRVLDDQRLDTRSKNANSIFSFLNGDQNRLRWNDVAFGEKREGGTFAFDDEQQLAIEMGTTLAKMSVALEIIVDKFGQG